MDEIEDNEEMESEEGEEIIGYCAYCKDPIFEDDEYVIKNGGSKKVYHVECWKQKHNIEEEVNFED